MTLAGDVAVGEHDAFGFAGGARGVDERGEVRGLNVVRVAVEGGIAWSDRPSASAIREEKSYGSRGAGLHP